jgi:Na+/melibiose symporter-like transporter
MRIGGSLLIIALGAIFTFAVTAHVRGIDIQAVGVILMVVGVIGLALSVFWMSTRRRTDVIQHVNGTTYVTPREPIDTI